MSEKIRSEGHERGESSKELSRLEHEQLREAVEKGEKAKHPHESSIEHIREKIEREASSAEQHRQIKHEKAPERHRGVIDKKAKEEAYQNLLVDVRKRLSKRQRVFSKFIHRPTVERVSEIGAKTVARPSGVLGAGIFGLIGSSIVFWMSHYYGFYYNYFVGIALILAGFAAGLVVEWFWRKLRRPAKG